MGGRGWCRMGGGIGWIYWLGLDVCVSCWRWVSVLEERCGRISVVVGGV
jgi:hypothetical protein